MNLALRDAALGRSTGITEPPAELAFTGDANLTSERGLGRKLDLRVRDGRQFGGDGEGKHESRAFV